ncbi:MAG: glycosyltransferase family 2 protein, partial [Verrucomicrobia bacterium]|nr:glycosyltransferase family 2 protein [Verrucomicrobiota bacterium]
MNHQPDSARCLTVIIPVYNEAVTLDLLLERVLAQPAVSEVLVVDVHHASNRGKGAAIRTALPSITSPWVLIQDADLE